MISLVAPSANPHGNGGGTDFSAPSGMRVGDRPDCQDFPAAKGGIWWGSKHVMALWVAGIVMDLATWSPPLADAFESLRRDPSQAVDVLRQGGPAEHVAWFVAKLWAKMPAELKGLCGGEMGYRKDSLEML